MFVNISWQALGDGSPGWYQTRVLYAYSDPEDDSLLYIGKADGPSVRDRFVAADKAALGWYLSRELNTSAVSVLFGEVGLLAGRRLSRQLLADIESLLIFAIQPVGNIQGRQSRISRSRLDVRCHGAWPHEITRFVEEV